MKPRVDRMNEIRIAFEQAQVGVRAEANPGMPYSHVVAYINFGFGGQRQATVTIDDNGECRVFMTEIYTIPEGKSAHDIDLGVTPLLFMLPGSTPGLAETIVRRVREASALNSETMPTKLVERPAPPVLISELETVADLIKVHEQYYLEDAYHDTLIAVLKKLGKVDYGEDQTWWFDPQIGRLVHTEFSPTSPRPLGPDGQRIIHPNAANIRLKPLLPGEPQQ